MKKCPFCAEEIQDEALKCKHCGEWLQKGEEIALNKEKATGKYADFFKNLKWVGGNDELNHYLLKAEGITRSGIHIRACIGLFIFGLLIIFIFKRLGKLTYGILYFVPIFIMFVITTCLPKMGFMSLFGFIAYIIAWVHSTKILSNYQLVARKRISEIDKMEEPSTDIMLEKGILLGKVLYEIEYAIKILNKALSMSGGSPFLFNLAGEIMREHMRIKVAEELYKRALESAKDEYMANHIKANLASIGVNTINC